MTLAMTAQAHLADLLALLFAPELDPQRLRTWLGRWPETAMMLQHLPGPTTAAATLCDSAANALVSHGRVDTALFVRLVSTFPGQVVLITEVAAAFDVAVDAAVPIPASLDESQPHPARTGAPWQPSPPLRRYIEWLAAQPMGLYLRGVGGDDIRLDLDEVYVPLSLSRHQHGGLNGRGSRYTMDGPDFPIEQLFTQLETCRHALILGDPGSGKTTALRKLAQRALHEVRRATGATGAAGTPFNLEPCTLPIFVRARSFKAADLNADLIDFVARELGDLSRRAEVPLDREVAHALWEHGEVLLLLDGLDEVSDLGLRARLCGYLETQLKTNRCNRLRVVVSSRFTGYDGHRVKLPSTSFARVELKPLSAGQARDLILRWFTEAGKRLGDSRADVLAQGSRLADMLDDPRFADHRRAMYATPLILTLLCVVVQRGHEMPRSRAEFYDTCLKVLLERWEQAKDEDGAAAADPRRVDLGTEKAIELLRPIAYAIHESGKRDQMDREELLLLVRDRLNQLGYIGHMEDEVVFDRLHKRAAIFAELAPDEFGFFHLGVQEYLAALHIATEGETAINTLASHFGESWWEEVTLLAVSVPRHPVFGRLMERLLDGAALLDPKQWELLRLCVREANFDPAPFVARFEREPELPCERLLKLLQLVRGIPDPRLVKAARQVAARTSDAEVRGEAMQWVAEIDRRETGNAKPFAVAVVGLAVDRRLVGELSARLRGTTLLVWPAEGISPPLADLKYEAVVDAVEHVVLVVGAETPWGSSEHKKALTKLRLLDGKCTVTGVLGPGSQASTDGAPPAIRAWLDMRGGWEVTALAHHFRPPPMRAILREVVRAPVIEPVTGMRLLWVPGGRFRMGSHDLNMDSKPPHWVRIRPFWIGETPVTNRQYRTFVEQENYREPHFWRDRRYNDPEQPVVGVTWDEAIAFCRWMSAVTKWVVDLPSEAQWEFAARGEDGRRYPWGDEEPDARRACFAQREQGRPAVVGSLPAGEGPFGTLDQAGNVWEFCKDIWDPQAYGKLGRPRKEPTDPLVTNGPDADFRSTRGGSWYSEGGELAAAYRRGYWVKDGGVGSSGFRVVVGREPALGVESVGADGLVTH